MTILLTCTTELFQNFFSNPLISNEYFAVTNDYQKCSSNNNLLTRITVGIIGKETMLIHDIFFHLLAGSVKLSVGGIKGLCAIPTGAFSLESDHQKWIKEGLVHLGFSAFYLVDIVISPSNINNTYPQDLLKKVENTFARFLATTDRKVIIIDNPETEKALKEKQAEAKAKASALRLEQQKVKEQAEALKRTQEELENTRNSTFMTEDDLEDIFRMAHEESKKQVDKECSQIQKPIFNNPLSSLDTDFSQKTSFNSSACTLTYDIDSEDEDEVLTPSSTWFEDEAALLKRIELIEHNKENHKAVSIPVKKPEDSITVATLPTQKQAAFQKKQPIQLSPPTKQNTLSAQEKHQRRLNYGKTINPKRRKNRK